MSYSNAALKFAYLYPPTSRRPSGDSLATIPTIMESSVRLHDETAELVVVWTKGNVLIPISLSWNSQSSLPTFLFYSSEPFPLQKFDFCFPYFYSSLSTP